jgi:hypothetical protein
LVPTWKASAGRRLLSGSAKKIGCTSSALPLPATLLKLRAGAFQIFDLGDGALHGDGEGRTELSRRLRKFTFIMPMRNFRVLLAEVEDVSSYWP